MRKSDSEPPERAREPLAYPTPRNGESETPDAEPPPERRHPLEGFRYALEGIVAVVRTQRHMRFHFFSVVLVLLMGLLFRLDKREMLVLLFTISIVLIAEMFNSAIEATVDLVTEEYHPKAKFAKDIAAGAVLVATLNAVVVAWVLFMGDLRLEQIRLRMGTRRADLSRRRDNRGDYDIRHRLAGEGAGDARQGAPVSWGRTKWARRAGLLLCDGDYRRVGRLAGVGAGAAASGADCPEPRGRRHPQLARSRAGQPARRRTGRAHLLAHAPMRRNECPMTDNPNSRRRWNATRIGLLIGVAALGMLWATYGQAEGADTPPAQGLTPATSFLVILLLLLLSAFFSMAESALTSIRHSWVRMLTDQKHRLAPYLAAFKSEPSRFLSTVQVGLNIVAFLASAVAATNLAEPLHALLRPSKRRQE
jgi:diacylglycerol kinase